MERSSTNTLLQQYYDSYAIQNLTICSTLEVEKYAHEGMSFKEGQRQTTELLLIPVNLFPAFVIFLN